jgi:hypothetical protein
VRISIEGAGLCERCPQDGLGWACSNYALLLRHERQRVHNPPPRLSHSQVTYTHVYRDDRSLIQIAPNFAFADSGRLDIVITGAPHPCRRPALPLSADFPQQS